MIQKNDTQSKTSKSVFNQSFETILDKDGVEVVRIDSTSIADIPGMINQWSQEIDKRKKDIL
ncbi:hypothetical protein KJ966_28665 [bacterium]|nr:hypothetical protein [bacterium]